MKTLRWYTPRDYILSIKVKTRVNGMALKKYRMHNKCQSYSTVCSLMRGKPFCWHFVRIGSYCLHAVHNTQFCCTPIAAFYCSGYLSSRADHITRGSASFLCSQHIPLCIPHFLAVLQSALNVSCSRRQDSVSIIRAEPTTVNQGLITWAGVGSEGRTG